MTHRSRCVVAAPLSSALVCIVLLAFSFVSASATDIPDISVDEILDRYVAAVGGEDALKKLTTRECMGKVTTDLTSRNLPVYESKLFRASAKLPGKCLFEELIDGPSARRGSDGLIHWRVDQCGIKSVDNGNLKLDFLTDPQGALRIREYFPNLTLKGTWEVNGKTTYQLEPSDLKPEYYSLYFDVETGLLLSIGYHWFVEDYREVDGVLFPHKIATGRKGGSTIFEISSVKHNVAMDDAIFAMPTQ